MSRALSAFLLGGLFALGLVVSGMTRPDNVVAFLDVLGPWDPSLAVVMVGAIGVYLPVYLWVRNRERPVFAEAFHWPTARGVDGRLVGGSALFGVGWGLSGFCPGPAIVAAGALSPAALWFGLGLAGGMLVHAGWQARPTRWTAPAHVDG